MNTRRNYRGGYYLSHIIILLLLNCLSVSYAYSGSQLTPHLQQYVASYPDIHFLHVQGDELSGDITKLTERLGKDATYVNYEHAAEIREDLLRAQFKRIEYLLDNHIPSATLFKTGKHTGFDKPYVCVITLDDFAKQDWQKSTPNNFSYQTFLEYTLDHEVYHCLDAYMHGPDRSKNTDISRISYAHFLSEYRADMYASICLRAAYPAAVDFLQLLARNRRVGLIESDTEHYTVAAIHQVIGMPESAASNKDRVTIARSIRKIARAYEPDITEYSHMINAANGLALYLDIDHAVLNDKNDPTTSPKIKLIIQEFKGMHPHIISNIHLDMP